MWVKTAGLLLFLLLAGLMVAVACGTRRWSRDTEALTARLAASRSAPPSPRYDERELRDLPDPVARFFRSTLRDGQPVVTGVRLQQQGSFRMGEADDSWRPFTATQTFNPQPPGFVWDARIRMAPGLPVHVRDSYLAGAGAMRGRVLGLLPVVDAAGAPELASAALQRYLAEAMWFPTALLPSQGVEWTAIDDSAARATLTDAGTAVSLEFRFTPDGGLAGLFTPSRFREVKGVYLPTPWGARVAASAERGGMRIPVDVEVEWQLPDRRLPYWRGRLTEVAYEFAAAQ